MVIRIFSFILVENIRAMLSKFLIMLHSNVLFFHLIYGSFPNGKESFQVFIL